MRYVIYGAGAVGGSIGARLQLAGYDVALVARGRGLEALRRDGLRFQTPDEDLHLPIPAYESPSAACITGEDVVLLTMKTQDSAAAIDELAATAPPEVAVVCAQNGVESERLALRRFAHVYGMLVYVWAQHVEPGFVECFSSPPSGVLDVGLAPAGPDAGARQLAGVLEQAGFSACPSEDIMRWKYAKLLITLGNAVTVLFGLEARASEWATRARAEALDCYRAAAIDFASDAEVGERIAATSPRQPVHGQEFAGGSSWQSLVRGVGTIEADYLNGEIVLLGRLHGVPTPVNEALARTASAMARNRERPGTADAERFEREVQAAASRS